MNQNLSWRFTELRRLRGVSGVTIAQNMGVSKAYVSQIENGKRSHVEPSKLLKLASKLRVNSDWLLTGFGDPSANICPPAPATFAVEHAGKPVCEDGSLSAARKELAEIAELARDLAARIAALERRLNKTP